MEQQTAIPVWISELLNGTPVTQEDGPTIIELPDGTLTHKVRIYGIIVSQEDTVVDDGTGSILIRAENKTEVGDTVLIIGKPRIYNNQPYIVGEIIKKIDPAWITLRKKQKKPDTKQDAITIIRELDNGEGADYTQVIAKIGTKGEETITHLLATGEIFETRPGKIKILD